MEERRLSVALWVQAQQVDASLWVYQQIRGHRMPSKSQILCWSGLRAGVILTRSLTKELNVSG